MDDVNPVNIITGTNWTLKYIIENGKLVATKYEGRCGSMKEAFTKLEEILVIESAKFTNAA